MCLQYIMDFLCDPAQVAAVLGGIYFCKVFYSSITDKKPAFIMRPILALLVILVLGVIYVVNYSCDSTTNYIAWGLVGLFAVYLVNLLMRK